MTWMYDSIWYVFMFNCFHLLLSHGLLLAHLNRILFLIKRELFILSHFSRCRSICLSGYNLFAWTTRLTSTISCANSFLSLIQWKVRSPNFEGEIIWKERNKAQCYKMLLLENKIKFNSKVFIKLLLPIYNKFKFLVAWLPLVRIKTIQIMRLIVWRTLEINDQIHHNFSFLATYTVVH